MTFDAVAATWFVLDSSVRALAAAAAVALVLRALRIRGAGVLHTAWSAVLFAMLLMPVLPSVAPALPIPVPAAASDLLGTASGTNDPSPRVVEQRQARNVITSVPSVRPGDPVPSAGLVPAPVTSARVPRSWLAPGLVVIYAAGVLLFVARLFYGWYLAAAMLRRARQAGRIRVDGAGQVYHSDEVTVPMTVGAIRPVIVLPVTWKTWDADTLAAVVAHEAEHVRRHDTSIAFAAHLNRALFWFHPLAWWLERKLAMTAEHACDEAAARAIAAPRRYAEILVNMADVVRRNRGRLAWQAVGVHGGGLLDRRIERLLGADAFAQASRAKKIAAAVGCLLAIATVVACRQQISAAPLREDPALTKTMADQAERAKWFEGVRDMTQAQADALEQRVALNPQDFDAREQLVAYYQTSTRVAWDKKVPGLRRHALWLIEHHPEHRVNAPALSPQYDPEGFSAAKKLWEAHMARPDASPFLVYRAASFFAPHDKPSAEQLILRGMKMDPDSAALKARMPPWIGGYEWPTQLASLYAATLRGSESVWGTHNDIRTHVDKMNSPYALQVKQMLDVTTDAKLLASVGSLLIQARPSTKDEAVRKMLDETRAIGVRYVERALQVDPNLASARATLVRMRIAERANEGDRLAHRAWEGHMIAEDIAEYAKKDLTGGKQQRDEAKARAEEVLKIAAAHPQDPAYSAAVMIAHQVLATEAHRDGDRERAVHHLRESVKVPTSERIQYALPSSWSRVVHRLLREGERERIVEFLETLAGLTISGRDRLLQDAQAIREGRMPASYQSMVAREGR